MNLLKLAPAVIAVALIAGAYFYGYAAGKNKQKVIIQERIIKSGERHADIEQRQAKWISVGGNAHIEWLREGSF